MKWKTKLHFKNNQGEICHKTTWDFVFFKNKLGTEYVDPPRKLNMKVKIVSGLTIINKNTNDCAFIE